MELDRLSVQLRLRNPWEAMDLGFAMARAWMPQVYGAWFAVALPLFGLALVVLPPQWAAMALWWLKPVLDRVVLHVFASGVFGDLPGVRATLRALPRALFPGLLASLLWLRFSPARSFHLAIWQLERQRGHPARLRREQLRRRGGGNAVWLTAACLHFELALALSLVALYDLLLPARDGANVGLFQLFYGTSPLAAQWTMASTYFAVVTILEPAYVAAGFALYLNRRTALEGWDLELALRRMGQRARAHRGEPGTGSLPDAGQAEASRGAAASLAVFAAAGALAALLGAAPSPAQAADATEPAVQGRDPAAEVRRVYQRPELDPYVERTVLEYQGPKQPRKPRGLRPLWWDVLMTGTGDIVRILAWAGLGLAVVFLVYYLLRALERAGGRTGTSAAPPVTLFGLDVRPESLPDDLAAIAASLVREGKMLQALSLLYRGALATLLHRDGVGLTDGDTEADCLHKSRTRVPTAAHTYLARLLGAWQRAAYAGRDVPRLDLEALCSEWPRHFGARRQEDAA